MNPEKLDFRVTENSPALNLGFKNFPMDEFGHQMTRIVPFGGDFEGEKDVTLIADKRAGVGAKIYFTLNGSEPTIYSTEYTVAIQLKNSTLIKARTFDANGIPVGFTTEANFTKVDELIYPSWYTTLIAGKYTKGGGNAANKAMEMEVHGALLVNIANDPDLIDATGGYNFGCYIKSLDEKKARTWQNAGLAPDWVIQQVNGEKVQNIADLTVFDSLSVWSIDTLTFIQPMFAYNQYGSKFDFTDQTGAVGANYLWDFGDGSTSQLQNPSHTYSQNGSHRVRLMVDLNCDFG